MVDHQKPGAGKNPFSISHRAGGNESQVPSIPTAPPPPPSPEIVRVDLEILPLDLSKRKGKKSKNKLTKSRADLTNFNHSNNSNNNNSSSGSSLASGENGSESGGRLAYLDTIRCFALYFVLQTHIHLQSFKGLGFSTSSVQTESTPLYIYQSLERVSAPLFFMLSGALHLHDKKEEESIADLYKKRLGMKILLPLTFWGITYKLFRKFILEEGNLNHMDDGNGNDSDNSDNVDDGSFFLLHTSLNSYYHLWYLFALIPIYVQLPLYKIFFQQARDSCVRYILVLWFLSVSSVFPVNFDLFFSEGFTPNDVVRERTGLDLYTLSTLGYAGYFILGALQHRYYRHFLHHKISYIGTCSNTNTVTFQTANSNKKLRRAEILLLVLSFLMYILCSGLIAVSSYYYNLEFENQEGQGNNNNPFLGYLTPLVIVQSSAIFMFLMTAGSTINNCFSASVISTVSKCAYGVYFVHPIFLDWTRKYLGDNFYYEHLPQGLSIPVTTLVLYFVSTIFTMCLRGIPHVRKIVP